MWLLPVLSHGQRSFFELSRDERVVFLGFIFLISQTRRASKSEELLTTRENLLFRGLRSY